MDSPSPPISLANFDLLRVIGRGGMGTVWLAKQQRPEREVAVKVVAPDDSLPPAFLRSLKAEGDIAARFDHDNLLHVYECGMVDDHYFLAMQYLPGGDLLSHIGERMAPDAALETLAAIADALEHIHQRGYVHRDLKPENVLFSASGKPVLVDFGIAKIAESTGELTAAGYTSGTAAYMSPEQILAKSVDGRSDLYSLGIVLFQCLTGELPFGGDSQNEIKHAHLTDRRPSLPPRLAALEPIVDRLVAPDPTDRYASAAEAAIAMRAAIGSSSVPAGETTSVATSVEPAGEPTPVATSVAAVETARPTPTTAPAAKVETRSVNEGPPPAHRRGVAWAAIIGVVAIAVALLAVLQLRESPGDEPPAQPLIAVLPIEDLIGLENSTLQALAFTDEIINRISAHPDLTALDLNSVTNPLAASLIGAADSPQADYLVQGRFVSTPTGTAIRVRMSDRKAAVIWESELPLTLSDSQANSDLQRRLAGEIAAKLGRELSGIDYCEPSNNADAQALYYEGLQRFSRRSPESVAEAARLLERAVALDPDFARAGEALARVYLTFDFWLSEDPTPYEPSREKFDAFLANIDQEALRLAQRSVDACPTLASAFFFSQMLATPDITPLAMGDLYEEALARDGNDVRLRLNQAELFAYVGLRSRAASILEDARRRDPLNPRISWRLAGMTDDVERRKSLIHDAAELGYNPATATINLAILALNAGDDEALDELLASSELQGPQRGLPISIERVRLGVDDPGVHAEIVAEVEGALPTAPAIDRRRYFVVASLLDARELMWQIVELAATGPSPLLLQQLFEPRVRHHVVTDRLLALGEYGNILTPLWDRYGAPDGCRWDGRSIVCEAPGSNDGGN